MHTELQFYPEDIYSSYLARKLYESKKYIARQLSVMKQENIRDAVKEEYPLHEIIKKLGKECGYCFEDECHKQVCINCPIYKKNDIPCFKLKENEEMWDMLDGPLVEDSLQKFAQLHEAWCKKIGLWEDMQIR